MKDFLKRLLANHTYFVELSTASLAAILSIVLAKYWGPQGQGEWAVLQNFISTLSILISLGLPLSTSILIRKDASIQSDIQDKIWIYLLYVFIGLFILGYVLNKYIPLNTFYSSIPKGVSGQVLLIIQLMLTVLVSLWYAWTDIKGKIRRNSIIRMGAMFLTLVFLVIYTQFINKEIQNFAHGYWMFQVFLLAGTGLILYPSIQKQVVTKKLKKINLFDLVISSGWVFLLTDIFQKLNYRLDIWFLNSFTSSYQVGIYSLASSFGLTLLIRPRVSQRNLLHNFKPDAVVGNKQLVKNEIIHLSKEMILICFMALFIAYFIIYFYLKQQYLESFPLMAIFTLAIVPLALTMPLSAYYIYHGKQTSNLIASILGMGMNVLSNLILIPKLGIWGAAWSSVLSYTTVAGYLAFTYYIYSDRTFT